MAFFKRRKLTPAEQRIYNQAFNAQIKKQEKEKTDLRLERIREHARAKAKVAGVPKSMRLMRAVKERIEKIDVEKQQAFILGMSLDGKKKEKK